MEERQDWKSNREPRGKSLSRDLGGMQFTDLLSLNCSNYLSYVAQSQHPEDGTTHSRLTLSPSIEKICHWYSQKVIQWRQFLNWGFLSHVTIASVTLIKPNQDMQYCLFIYFYQQQEQLLLFLLTRMCSEKELSTLTVLAENTNWK